jgi:hypothetical protein
MRIRTVKPVYIVPGRLEIRGLECDKTAKPLRVQRAELQGNASAHRAADEERSFQAERMAESQHRLDVSLGGQQIFSGREPLRRKRLAVPGHVEGNEAAADTRQWRFVLNDEAFTAQRRPRSRRMQMPKR